MLLIGKPIADSIEKRLAIKHRGNSYFAIFLLSDDYSSQVYVRKKEEFGRRIGLEVKVFVDAYDSVETLLRHIIQLNNDPYCISIIVQLPLPEKYQSHKSRILSCIHPSKDPDGLSCIGVAENMAGVSNFIPATPKAVILLLDYYSIIVSGKIVSLVGQSNLIGKPLALELTKRNATILWINHLTPESKRDEMLRNSDIIITATGVVELLTSHNTTPGQTIIDVGYGHKNGRACGDVDKSIYNHVDVSPVPGGVGVVTVASLFNNISDLYDRYHQTKNRN